MTLRQHKSIIKEYFFYVQNIESIAKAGKRVAIFSIDFQTTQSWKNAILIIFKQKNFDLSALRIVDKF